MPIRSAPRELSTDDVLYLRLRGQGLIPAYSTARGPNAAVDVARLTGGLQAQDLFAATLAVRVRAAGSTLSEVERNRLAERSLVWTWLMRGTLHLIPAADLDWYLAVIGPPLIAATARRRAELGLDEDTYAKGLAVVLAHLETNGPMLREEVGTALAAEGLPSGYSVERHLLYRAALEGQVCFGPDRGNAPGAGPTFVLLDQWLGRGLPQFDAAALHNATVRLAERYLHAFGPATLADFSAWSGINVRDLRGAWDALLPGLAEVRLAGAPAYLPASRLHELAESAPPSPFVRLLGAFDTYILGHKSRSLIDDRGAYAARTKGGGMLPPMVLVDGRVAGTWQTNRKGRRVSIAVDPFEPFPKAVEDQVAAEIEDIGRFVAAGV